MRDRKRRDLVDETTTPVTPLAPRNPLEPQILRDQHDSARTVIGRTAQN
jgi:hypothetical protein